MTAYNFKAIAFALQAHNKTNQQYGPYPYAAHLTLVAHFGYQFLHLLPTQLQADAITACYLHDTIEDCRLTYNDVLEVAGVQAAEIVYALTNEKGKNRSERANQKYFDGIRNTQGAVFVKMCDRLANCYVSFTEGPLHKIEKYRAEHSIFMQKLFANNAEVNTYQPMIDLLETFMQHP